ncbi:hotdog fold thioesterase [Mangrovimonas aestuarii]|uniref:hotdog fold thioesterase n=1 Tax=Mangrovimonas aestuarii TaxID=3018443 RepID=UPI00237927F2|nr:hotdog fold thioesterase [Mangrovimonas aestuarii]
MTPEAIVNKMFENDAFSQWLGIAIDDVKEGYCQLSMTVRAEMLNGFKIAHGGITYSLADSALAFAANSRGKQALSIDTSINHMEKLVEGDKIVAIASEESVKNRFGFYRIEIKKDDVLVALFKGTVYRTNNDWKED